MFTHILYKRLSSALPNVGSKLNKLSDSIVILLISAFSKTSRFLRGYLIGKVGRTPKRSHSDWIKRNFTVSHDAHFSNEK